MSEETRIWREIERLEIGDNLGEGSLQIETTAYQDHDQQT